LSFVTAELIVGLFVQVRPQVIYLSLNVLVCIFAEALV